MKTWVSMVHSSKEEPGPGMVLGGVPRRCPGREPQPLRERQETRQHRQEGAAYRTGHLRSQAAHAPEREVTATRRAEVTSARPRTEEADS